MKFRKKVLIAALALTLTSTNSITKDIPLLNKANISFAAEEPKDDEGQTEETKYVYTLDHVKGIVEVLKDELKVLLNNNDFNDTPNVDPNNELDNLELYKATYDSLLKLEEDSVKTDEVKYKEVLVNILLNEDLKAKFNSNKTKIDEALEALEENPENEDQKKILTSVKEKLDPIVSTLGDVQKQEDSEGVHITIKNGENYNQYLVEKEGLKEEIPVLKTYVNENIDFLQEEEKKLVESELNAENELLEDPSITKEELEVYRDKLKVASETIDKAKKDLMDSLLAKIEEIKGKLGKEYISKKYHDDSIKKLEEMEKEIPNANKEALDKHLQKLTLMDQEIEKIKEKVTGLNLSNLTTEIDKAKSNQVTQAYYRASKIKKDAYDKAINEAEEYLQTVLESVSNDPDTFDPTKSYKAEETDKHVNELKNAENELDGLDYDSLLNKAENKFEENKKSLSEESIKELQKKLDLLKDKNNKDNTVEDVNSFSDLIDEKVAEYKKTNPSSTTDNPKKTTDPSDPNDPSNKKGDVKVRKVEVPKAEDKGKKNARSIVRTGIDSVKIFAIVAVVAVVLLLVTKRKKDNK